MWIKIAVFALSVTVIFSFRFLLGSQLPEIDKKYQTLEAVFCGISEHLKVSQKYSASHLIVNSLLGVWKCVGALSPKFNILHQTLQTRFPASLVAALIRTDFQILDKHLTWIKHCPSKYQQGCLRVSSYIVMTLEQNGELTFPLGINPSVHV